jgi:ubiquinol oxidase
MATTALIDHGAAEYGRYGSVADLFRQIGRDERVHKLDSLANLGALRPFQAHEAGEAS